MWESEDEAGLEPRIIESPIADELFAQPFTYAKASHVEPVVASYADGQAALRRCGRNHRACVRSRESSLGTSGPVNNTGVHAPPSMAIARTAEAVARVAIRVEFR